MKTSCDYNIEKGGETLSVTSLVLKNYLSETYNVFRPIRPSSGTPVFKVLRKIVLQRQKIFVYLTQNFKFLYTPFLKTFTKGVTDGSCGACGGVVVKELRYKPAGRGFDSRWCHWNFSVT
jgi:hypothetical protein